MLIVRTKKIKIKKREYMYITYIVYIIIINKIFEYLE